MRDLLRRCTWRLLLRLEPTLSSDLAFLDYCRRWVAPADAPGSGEGMPFVPTECPGSPGLSLLADEALQRLRRWREVYADLFRRLREDPRINTQCLGKPYLHNGMYPTPDAEIYAAMILDAAPRHIIEIGAGFSTLIARTAVAALGNGCRITVADPEPRTDVRAAADVILRERVEAGAVEPLTSGEGLLLFIDSSHIARAGGDVPYLFTALVPRLRAGTLVHVHDVFLPYDYPPEYRRRLYTEQYILQALLAHSPRYRVHFATHWMSRAHPEAMRAAFGDIVGREGLYYGASFWFGVE